MYKGEIKMKKYYNVWLTIEEVTENPENYKDIHAEKIGKFFDEEKASAQVKQIIKEEDSIREYNLEEGE